MTMHKIKLKKFIPLTLLPIAVGALAGLLTRGGMESFELMRKPPLSPPAWLFPVVWTLLYAMMGAASYFVSTACASPVRKRRALIVYAAQLVANFLWTLIFFGAGAYLAAFVWLVIMWLMIALTAAMFGAISPTAGRLLLPYLLWTAFAGYLNLGVYLLN